jgi:hypothetical protein
MDGKLHAPTPPRATPLHPTDCSMLSVAMTHTAHYTTYRNLFAELHCCELWSWYYKGKGKGHPRTGYEGTEVEKYSSTLF